MQREKKYDVLTSGYVSMDHIICIASPVQIGCTSIVTNSDNIKTFYGGCGVNIAVSLNKLGKTAMPILRVGPDWEGNGFKAYLQKVGVPLEGTKVLPDEATSTCYLLQDNNNDHITIFYPGSMDKKYAEPLPDEFFTDARLGVITVGSEPDNRYFLEQCKKHDIPVIFGMKDDTDAFPDDFLQEILLESSIIFTNEVECEVIKERFGYKAMTDLFEKGKAKAIITTLGKDGSVCYERTEQGIAEHHIGICKVEKIVDATGTGDAYIAGFLYGYLNEMEMEKCCRLGTALASFIIQAAGCCTNIPDTDTLERAASTLKTEE